MSVFYCLYSFVKLEYLNNVISSKIYLRVIKGLKMKYEIGIRNFKIRFADKNDTDIILYFINSLADYEKLSNQVTATKDILYDSLFVKKQAQVLIGEFCGKPVGFALFFYNFSTFLGKANLYLEDLFILENYRRKGFGKAFFSVLAKICIDNNCDRLDWWCLDCNTSAIQFYKSLGAAAMSDWTVYRLEKEALRKLLTCHIPK